MLLSYENALNSDTRLAEYGSNSIILFALQLKFDLEDIDGIALDALTDGSDDKKCDLIYVDTEEGYIVLAQGYRSHDIGKPGAPSNKASDLNTAVGWLLERDIEELPERLRSSADLVRQALVNNRIRTFYIWYVHNLPESDNVAEELKTTEMTARSIVSTLHPEAEIEISAVEVGRSTLEEWYKSTQTTIAVSGDFEVDVPGGYVITEADWHAYVTSVPARWLHALFQEHGLELFSANVRGYLGSRRSDRNINNGIKTTAETDPDHLWTYNNGITALVHEFEPPRSRTRKKKLGIKGISIVNGAQTTGAIGSASLVPSESAMVPARFVKCSSSETISKIIRYNNSQNRVTAPDFRSNDPIQQRLRSEFAKIPEVSYAGGRRGSEDGVNRRPATVNVPSEKAAQSLAALHGDPALAYNGKSEIWESNSTYSKFFSERTNAKHIVFAYSLLRAVDSAKKGLIAKATGSVPLTSGDADRLAFLRKRGANFLFVSAISRCLETLLDRQIGDLFRLSFGDQTGLSVAESNWKPIIESTLAFSQQLNQAIEFSLRTNANVTSVNDNFHSLVEATKNVNVDLFGAFAAKVELA